MKGSNEVLERQVHVRSTLQIIYIVALSNPRSLNHFSRECGSPSPLKDHTEYSVDISKIQHFDIKEGFIILQKFRLLSAGSFLTATMYSLRSTL